MCAGACVWSKIGAVVFGVSQEDITAYGKKHGTEEFKWRACLISCRFVLEKGNLHIPVFDNFMNRSAKSCSDIGPPNDGDILEYEIRQEVIHEICNQLANSSAA